MNCVDVRRALLADPGRVAPGEDAHLLVCDSCRRFAAEVAVREGLIDHALHVPLPPGFERRLLELGRRRPIGRQRGPVAVVLVALAIATIAATARIAPQALAGVDFPVRGEVPAIPVGNGEDAVTSRHGADSSGAEPGRARAAAVAGPAKS